MLFRSVGHISMLFYLYKITASTSCRPTCWHRSAHAPHLCRFISDLHITGKFNYLPGTGRCFRFFLLRGHVWYRRRPASVYNNIGRCPAGHRTTSNVKNTLAQDCKHFNSSCLLHLNHLQLLKRNMYICIFVFGLKK